MSDYTHWFYVSESSDGFHINTMGKGNHPAGKYWYGDMDDVKSAIKRFEAEGYKNLTKKT